MNGKIYYYSGTGNSLWVARTVATELEVPTLHSMSKSSPEKEQMGADCIGFVFPVYIWGLPARVVKFVEALPIKPETFVFALAVNGGQISRTLLQLEKILKKKGVTLSIGKSIKTPSNYIPWGGPGPKERQQQLFSDAELKCKTIAASIKNREVLGIDKGPLWQRILFTAIYNLSFARVPQMDKAFFADDKCNFCEICEKVCPTKNITVKGSKPKWHHRCEQCFACLQWCPKKAIQCGNRTVKFERYHHPAITLKDLL